MTPIRRLLARVGRRLTGTSLVRTSDPDMYRTLANRFILGPAELHTGGPRYLARPASIEIHLRFEYIPPDAEALVAAVVAEKEKA